MRKILMATAVVAFGSYLALRSSSEPVRDAAHDGGAHDAKLLQDRVWLERLPKHDKDRVEVFVALSAKKGGRQGPVGAFEKISMWEGHFQAFRYESDGPTMRVIFPQTGATETLTVKATRCKEADMDFCLDISGNGRGAHRYYSRRGMEIRSLDEAEATIRSLAPVGE